MLGLSRRPQSNPEAFVELASQQTGLELVQFSEFDMRPDDVSALRTLDDKQWAFTTRTSDPEGTDKTTSRLHGLLNSRLVVLDEQARRMYGLGFYGLGLVICDSPTGVNAAYQKLGRTPGEDIPRLVPYAHGTLRGGTIIDGLAGDLDLRISTPGEKLGVDKDERAKHDLDQNDHIPSWPDMSGAQWLVVGQAARDIKAKHGSSIHAHGEDRPEIVGNFADGLDRWRTISSELRFWISDEVLPLEYLDHQAALDRHIHAVLASGGNGSHPDRQTVAALRLKDIGLVDSALTGDDEFEAIVRVRKDTAVHIARMSLFLDANRPLEVDPAGMPITPEVREANQAKWQDIIERYTPSPAGS